MILLKILNEKMKKVLFFMVLLFLGLGIANLNAQVRIGGNTAPNASAVLDLNANDTNNGTKGLALPRVSLASNTTQITTGVANLTGMLVYNTNTALGVGIYSWIGGIWKKVDAVPAPTPADSGLFLISLGTTVSFNRPYGTILMNKDTLRYNSTNKSATLTMVLDTTVMIHYKFNQVTQLSAPGIAWGDFCTIQPYNNLPVVMPYLNMMYIIPLSKTQDSVKTTITCLRPHF